MTYGTLPLAFVLVTIATRAAHHGSTGRYDRTRPLYVSGTVQEAAWEYPHARLTVDVPAGLSVPDNAARFGELDRLNDRDVVGRLAAQPAGRVEILFPPDIMSPIMSAPDRPERGARVEAVVFRRCDQGNNWDGELRVQAFAAPTGEVLFRGAGTRTRYSDGCPGDSPEADEGGASSARPGAQNAPDTAEDDGGVPVGAIAAAGLGAGAAVLAGLAWIVHRRRQVGGR